MCRRKSGWTGFAITCFPCIAMTRQKSSTKLNRSCCLMWETLRWFMAGRAATSRSECPCWTSRHEGLRHLSPTQIGTGHLNTHSWPRARPTRHWWASLPCGVGIAQHLVSSSQFPW
ncbi:RGD1564450 (predicted), isoform CRA_a [Rattus norvegicus]|uniref:RGD1564450 (Predicted), isoform CRA_a n=1 Tax=Rattus norvegicus TaxID=10116 RepID=A6JJM5_RAT|nr:small integral membrane protein 29 isoform 1 [Rattus norvegicus]EDL96891.1 RGD1564450 (predicted), isoform CRA_a [Rattus norvegicus]|eukprot:NP_001099847.1 uncharacterized protein C6orf1 homolog [Rattus norvegicus]